MATPSSTVWDTELGKALAKVVPPECKRVIIDINLDEAVIAYYETYATDPILSLDWSNWIGKAKVIKGDAPANPLQIGYQRTTTV